MNRSIAIAVTLISGCGFIVSGLAAPGWAAQGDTPPATTLVETVRQATARFQHVEDAVSAGYAPMFGCVSGPQDGAMGIHYINGDLVGDGALDAERPEALLYEMVDGEMRFLGVEYLVLADAWHDSNEAPPALLGQLFNYVGSPNRYGNPPFYELHVWAGKANPHGTFADWNPDVTCDEFAAE
jgi:hypothetical protein